jgi:apolipoprotein N-acyltransferase
MDRYVALSSGADGRQSSGLHDVTHLIWPESPFPFILTREPAALAQIAKLLSPRTVLITGATRLPEHFDPSNPHAYNSMYVIDHDGSILTLYDKVHLVPFGEYLPFEHLLERIGLQELTRQQGGFLAGDRRRLIAIPGAPRALPVICYEIIFADHLAPSGERAGWIINLTNDGWFGISSGPYQHFEQARVTAIEQGLPLVRAANTGISAVVDPVGRIVNSLPLGTEGILDSALPRALTPPIYSRVGDLPTFFAVAVALLLVGCRRLTAGNRKI